MTRRVLHWFGKTGSSRCMIRLKRWLLTSLILLAGFHLPRPRLNPNVEYSLLIYKELYILSRAVRTGLLSWEILAAWFFCRGPTVERDLTDAREDRTFSATRFYTDENNLQNRINGIHSTVDIVSGGRPLSPALVRYPAIGVATS
jgi:hypothetical protein